MGTILRWLSRPIGLHVLAAPVLLLAFAGGAIGGLVGASVFDPGPLWSTDDQPFDPSLHPTTSGYIGEVVVAAIPVLVICLLLIPLLRRAGSPAPRVAAFMFALIPIVCFALETIDEAIPDHQPGGCCAGPGLTGPWWHLWVAAAVLIAISSLVSAGVTIRRRQEQQDGLR